MNKKNLFCSHEAQSGRRYMQVKRHDWWGGKKRHNNPRELHGQRLRDELACGVLEMSEMFSIDLLGLRGWK